jgi:hypothetical protein
MAQFTNLFPNNGQQDVTRTSIIRFTIIDDSYGVNINTLSVSINGSQAVASGSFINNYRGTIYPSVGKYVVGIYPKAPQFLPYASDINVILGVSDSISGNANLSYHFYTDGYVIIEEDPIPAHSDGSRACIKDKPEFFPLEIGAQLAHDNGIGTQVDVHWKQAAPYNPDDIIYYNVYFSSEREQVFQIDPEFLVDGFSATIGGFSPGDSIFLGVRASEFNPNRFTTNGLIQAGENMYFYPLTSLISDISTVTMSIPVDSTDGFPNSGIIQIEEELIKYSSISANNFIVAVSGRGTDNTGIDNHSSGSEVKVYKGREDSNVRVITVTPSFQKPNYALTWRLRDAYGDDGYRDGYDGYGIDGYYGYRQEKYDSITTDGYSNDQSGEFPRLDYCGTYRPRSPKTFMSGQCIGSYFGGVQARFDSNGNRYLVKETNVQTHMLQREELLLETTGEPFVLLRRMWTGVRCACVMLRQEHPDARCPICFATGFVSGYNQFFNSRSVDRRILVRVEPSPDDLDIVDSGGLTPNYSPSCWTLPYPMIKDRDVLIRFNADGTEEFRYEILSVDRVRSFFGQNAAQKFKIIRLPKTDQVYQFPVTRKYSQYPNVLYTSSNIGPGLKQHSHNFVVPVGMTDFSKLKVATFESEGHNHIIINGIVYDVLGHTHTLPLL